MKFSMRIGVYKEKIKTWHPMKIQMRDLIQGQQVLATTLSLNFFLEN